MVQHAASKKKPRKPPKQNIATGDRVHERKLKNRRHGVIISADPNSTKKGRWVVKFDGVEATEIKTSGQLSWIKESSPNSSDDDDNDCSYLPCGNVDSPTSNIDLQNGTIQEEKSEIEEESQNGSNEPADDESQEDPTHFSF